MANKVSTFLSKLGGILAAFSPEVPVVAGVLSAIIPGTKDDKIIQTVQSDFGEVLGVISNVEAFGQALNTSGPDKLKAAAGPVAKVLLSSSAFAGKKIANPDLFMQGAQKIADGSADCWNAVHPDEVKIENEG